MSEHFEKNVMEELKAINGRVGGLAGRIDGLSEQILRLDAKTDALNRKIDTRADEILAHMNDYATKTDHRLRTLEAHPA